MSAMPRIIFPRMEMVGNPYLSFGIIKISHLLSEICYFRFSAAKNYDVLGL